MKSMCWLFPARGFDWTDDIRVRIVMLPEAAELKFAMEEMGDFLN